MMPRRSAFLFLFISSLIGWSSTSEAQNPQVLPYLDADFPCLDQATADRYVRDFKINVRSFGGMELCRSQMDAKKLFNDLQIVELGRFQMNKQNLLIRNFVPADQYYVWLRGQTRSINRGNDIPAATAYNQWGNFTMQDGWAQLSTLGRVGTLIHEARHTAGYGHTACRQGSYAGSSMAGCDRTYADGGSHAVEMEYYARVSTQGLNFHPVYKSMARLMAMARANFVFNQAVLKPREALLALDRRTGTPVLFDGPVKVGREMPVAAGWLKRTSFGAVLFDGLKPLSIEMYQNTGFRPTLIDTYSYFKLLDRFQQQVRDFEEYDENNRRFGVVMTADQRLSSYNFPKGAWGPWVQSRVDIRRFVTELPSGQRGLFAMGSDLRLHPVDPLSGQLKAPLQETWDPSFVKVSSAQGRRVALRSDGVLYEQINGQWVPWPEAKFNTGPWADLVAVPLYDAFEIQR